MDGPLPGGGATRPTSVESKASWRTAWLILAILSVSFGSSLLIVVGMKPIQESLGTDRSLVAAAGAFLGAGPVVAGLDLVAVHRPRADGPVRQWRRISALAGLCQPLVRPTPRHGDRADFVGPVRRGRRLAGAVRAHHRKPGLADADGRFRRAGAGHAPARDPAAQAHTAAPRAAAPAARDRRRPAHRRPASQPRAGAALH